MALLQSQANQIARLNKLRLRAFADTLQNQYENPNIYLNLTYEEKIEECIARQEEYQKQSRFNRLIKGANLSDKLTLNEIANTPSPGLTPDQLQLLTSKSWIEQPKTIIIQGACGVGKTCLSSAIGISACAWGYKVQSIRFSDLIEELVSLKFEDRQKLEGRLNKINVLIIEDLGLQQVPTENEVDFF